MTAPGALLLQQGPLRGLCRAAAAALDRACSCSTSGDRGSELDQASSSGRGSQPAWAPRRALATGARAPRRAATGAGAAPAAAASAAAPAGEQRPWGHSRDEDLPMVFSLRPSVTSPLHTLHREHQRLQRAAEFADLSAAAQERLARELDVGAEEEVDAALSARRAKLAHLTNALGAAGRAPALPPPAGPGQGQGYMYVLEQQLAERHAEDLQFQRVLSGERDVWDYWFNHFAPRYQGLPGLAPLDAAINARSAVEEAQVLRRRALRSLAPPEPQRARQPRIDAMGRAQATGRRKTAAAQVFIWEGPGRVVVNARPLAAYFADLHHRAALLRPLMLGGAVARFNVAVRVAGSGLSGQAQAAAHGIARAMQNFDPAAYRPLLKRAGLLKRDPRMVERKKPGRKKARKAFAWVKR